MLLQSTSISYHTGANECIFFTVGVSFIVIEIVKSFQGTLKILAMSYMNLILNVNVNVFASSRSSYEYLMKDSNSNKKVQHK